MVLAQHDYLGKVLIQQGIVTPEQLQTALDYQKSAGVRLGEALTALELCSDEQVARSLALQFDLPFVDLDETAPSPECVATIPAQVALKYCVLPVRMEGDRLIVAVADPT